MYNNTHELRDCTEQNGLSNLNSNHNHEAIHNPKRLNSCFTSLSRDQNGFLPINFQIPRKQFCTLLHTSWAMGVIRNQCSNTPHQTKFTPTRPFHRNFVTIWPIDLVGASETRCLAFTWKH